MSNLILFGIIMLINIISIILMIIYVNKYKKETDETKKKSLKKTRDIFIGIFAGVISLSLLIGFIGYKLKRSADKKILAQKLIDLGTKPKSDEVFKDYDSSCNIMFEKSGDKEMYKQFLDMKGKRPIEEVRNLCGTTAKMWA